MSCGLTPDLMRMLEAMAAEKEQLATQAAQELADTTEQLRKKAEASATTVVADRADWTSVYEKWDAWQDPEELAQQEQAAREKAERAARAAAQGPCNHDHSTEQRLMDMTTAEKLAACDEFRRLGNLFFEQGQYQRAAYHYHKALVYFEYVFPDTDDENSAFDALRLKTLLNFAACRLRTGHLDDVLSHTEQALKLDPTNAKALYRRAQAWRLRDEFSRAMEDVNAALAHIGSADRSVILQEKTLLQARMLAYKMKSREVSSAMFDQAKCKQAKTGASTSNAAVDDVALTVTTKRSEDNDGIVGQLESWQPCRAGLSELRQLLNHQVA
ncbi:hypothetical protein P43SY_006524 [Pythium insidiosum]|uniref:peptidylprolyl isomerase n=1 Tax=Pythium insidiosum TaxID=114742 RepID=A0AAD5M2G6_PYTIN|nr:hypothetical protein P43SY_006524 [Pythium insidiosum]